MVDAVKNVIKLTSNLVLRLFLHSLALELSCPGTRQLTTVAGHSLSPCLPNPAAVATTPTYRLLPLARLMRLTVSEITMKHEAFYNC